MGPSSFSHVGLEPLPARGNQMPQRAQALGVSEGNPTSGKYATVYKALSDIAYLRLYCHHTTPLHQEQRDPGTLRATRKSQDSNQICIF